MNQLVKKMFASAFVLVVVFIVFIVFIYGNYNPEENSFFPKCVLYRMTGFECPSCGVQRAVHSLLNGDFKKAFWYNPFLFFALPYVLAVIYAKKFCSVSSAWCRILLHRYSIYFYIIIYLAWWIIRNL